MKRQRNRLGLTFPSPFGLFKRKMPRVLCSVLVRRFLLLPTKATKRKPAPAISIYRSNYRVFWPPLKTAAGFQSLAELPAKCIRRQLGWLLVAFDPPLFSSDPLFSLRFFLATIRPKLERPRKPKTV